MKPTRRKIDRVRVIKHDGKILVRLYTGREFSEAEISAECLATLIADGADALCAALQGRGKGV